MVEYPEPQVPQTLEGYYVLHEVVSIRWPDWLALDPVARQDMADSLATWLTSTAAGEGDSAAYSVIGSKGDLMFVHYRRTPEALNKAELSLRRNRLSAYFEPAYSFLSVIEVSLHELTAMAARKLAESGLRPGSPEYDSGMEAEMAGQKERVQDRLFRRIPEQRYICFYPMNKRRGEAVNWYTLTADQRRDYMRGHGRIGHKYHEQVTQVIAGAVGLDDWEWGVSLHADDPLAFKKLVYEMRFDPGSALFAEFGPFYVGLRARPEQVAEMLMGRWP